MPLSTGKVDHSDPLAVFPARVVCAPQKSQCNTNVCKINRAAPTQPRLRRRVTAAPCYPKRKKLSHRSWFRWECGTGAAAFSNSCSSSPTFPSGSCRYSGCLFWEIISSRVTRRLTPSAAYSPWWFCGGVVIQRGASNLQTQFGVDGTLPLHARQKRCRIHADAQWQIPQLGRKSPTFGQRGFV
jgi:hypothetical protein